MTFDEHKSAVLKNIRASFDRSPKGSLDQPILTLITFINSLSDYVTTSSCSGRISLYHETDVEDENRALKKGSGSWLLAKHDVLEGDGLAEIKQCLAKVSSGTVVFKHEPFVMHVQCRDASSAQKMLQVARESGFRESGISLGQKKVILGIRTSSNVLELPIVQNGILLLSDDYLKILSLTANSRFRDNAARTKAFERVIHETFGKPSKMENENLNWRTLPLRKESLEAFNRWGHSASALNDVVYIFGGYGAGSKDKGCHRRLNDLISLKLGLQGKITYGVVSTINSPPAPRVRHSASVLSELDAFVIFGGRSSPGVALNDVAIGQQMEDESVRWHMPMQNDNECPSPRWAHTGSTQMLIGGEIVTVIFGGRDKDKVLDDVWFLRVDSGSENNNGWTIRWESPEIHGSGPCNRFSHSACSIKNKVVIYGGYKRIDTPETSRAMGLLDDIFVLSSEGNQNSLSWTKVVPNRSICRFSHQAVALDENKMLVLGGFCEDTGDYTKNGAAVLDLESGNWSKVESSDKYGNMESPVTMFQKYSLSMLKLKSAPGNILLLALGGGALCFSFGFYFNPACYTILGADCDFKLSGDKPEIRKKESAVLIDSKNAKKLKTALEKLGLYDKNRRIARYQGDESGIIQNALAIPVTENAVALLSKDQDQTHIWNTKLEIVEVMLPLAKKLEISTNQSPLVKSASSKQKGNNEERKTHETKNAVLVSSGLAKSLKNALEDLSWYDKTRRIAPYGKPGLLAVPITQTAAKTIGCGSIYTHKSNLEAIVGNELELVYSVLPPARHLLRPESKSKVQTMKCSILEICRLSGIDLDHVSIADELPKKIEMLDDVAILPSEAFSSRGIWNKVFQAGETDDKLCLWRIICKYSGAKRVILQSRIDQGLKRESQAELVYPRSKNETTCDVLVKQNGVLYSLDLLKCMFSSGNISEKLRVAKFNCHGQIVVDMYAGIGYFTLPYLVHTSAAHVHACEWNSNAVAALRNNLKINKVSNRCTLHVGDNRETTKQLYGTANRVNLGLIPSSEDSWLHAVKLISADKVGWLHIHANVTLKPKEEATGRSKWGRDVSTRIGEIFDQVREEGWVVECVHVEEVKSYGPHVYHLVADISCKPPGFVAESGRGDSVDIKSNGTQSDIKEKDSSEHAATNKVERVQFPRTLSDATALFAQRQPIIFTGLKSWDEGKLRALINDTVLGEREVSVHVGDKGCNGKISFVDKSFKFEVFKFKNFITEASQEQKHLYLRAVGKNFRKDRADFWKDYPELAENSDFSLSESKVICAKEKIFSSVLRIASPGLQLWTHYDVMDNVLFQKVGTKRVLLFRPDDIDALYFDGSTSRVIHMDDPLNEAHFPLFQRALKNSLEVVLQPGKCLKPLLVIVIRKLLNTGEALYIPALWPHNVRANEFSVAVNVFWKTMPESLYWNKDLYGNRDPRPAEKALKTLQDSYEALREVQSDGTSLPDDFVRFYAIKGSALYRHEV